MHFLMVDEHLGRQSFEYPDVLKSLVRSQSFSRIPLEALLYEISEVRVFFADDKLKRLAVRFA